MAAAARMACGGSGGAPHAPAADDRGSLLGGERTRRRRSLPWSAPGGGGRAGGRRASALPRSNASSSRRARTRRTRELRSARRRARRLRGLLAAVAAALVVALIAGILRAGPARKRAAHGDRRPGRTPRRPVARGRGEAPRPGAAPRARGGPPRRLGRLARRAPRGARARLADPRVAPGVRLARRRDRVQPRREAPGHGDDQRGPRSGTRRPGAPSGRPCARRRAAGRGSTSAPTGGRWRSQAARAASSCGTWRPRKELRELTDPAAATPTSPRSPPFGSAPTAGSSPPARRRRTTSRCGTAASGRVIGRPITVKPPGTGGAQSISFSPDSKRIAVPGAPGTVGIWEVATGRRVGKPLAIGSDGRGGGDLRRGRPDADRERRLRLGVPGRHRNGTTDPPAAVGRQRRCRLAGSQSGWTAGGRGLVRGVGLRVGREDRRAVRLSADGRHEPGQRRRVQPRRPDAGELRICARRSSGTWTESRRSASRWAGRPI